MHRIGWDNYTEENEIKFAPKKCMLTKYPQYKCCKEGPMCQHQCKQLLNIKLSDFKLEKHNNTYTFNPLLYWAREDLPFSRAIIIWEWYQRLKDVL